MQATPHWERLRIIREAAGLSQAEVADAIGVTQSHLSRVERGNVGMSYSKIEEYLAVCRHHLAIVPADGGDPDRVSVDHLQDYHRRIVRDVADLVPHLPEALVEHLADELRAWRARYASRIE